MQSKKTGRAAPERSRNQQQPSSKKLGTSDGLTPHSLLKLLPKSTADEQALRRERVRLYGQREPIEIVDGLILAGRDEYVALVAEGVEPRVTTLRTEPPNLVEYVLRRNIPREMTTLDRGCIAVLAYQQVAKAAARERMTLGTKLPEGWEGKRWFEHAAHIVGTRPGCVRSLASIQAHDPAMFEAVRNRRIRILHDARMLISEFKNDHGDDPLRPVKNQDAAADRQEALKRYEVGNRKKPLKDIVHDMKREKRVKRLPPSTPNGKHWVVYQGRMEDEHAKIASKSVDLVFADILYGERQAPPMAREVSKVARKSLVDGGIMAMIAGHVGLPAVMQACLAEGLHFLVMGFVDYCGSGGQGLRGALVEKVDCEPVLFFSTTPTPKRKIVHLKFKSGTVNKMFFAWQKSTDSMTAIIKATVGPNSVVLDPCCGSGSTLEAAIRLGHTAIGIELDPERANISQSRLVDVEKALASDQLTAIVQRTGATGPARPETAELEAADAITSKLHPQLAKAKTRAVGRSRSA